MQSRKNSVNRRQKFSSTVAHRTHQAPPNPVLQHAYDQRAAEAENNNHTKSKVIERIENMTEQEIDKISRQLEKITGEDHKEVESQIENEELDDHDLEAEEIEDRVNNLPEAVGYNDQRSVTELSEYSSRVSHAKTRSSQRSSKSYVDKLRRELESERNERKKLESEIEKLKKLSSEIGSKLGINLQKN